MLEGIFGRNALTEEQMESALFGLGEEIGVQVEMVAASSILQHLATSAYFHGYVFGIGTNVSENACELFNVKPSSPDISPIGTA